MPQRTDTFDLARLGLTSGEGRRLDLHTDLGNFDYGGQRYEADPALAPVRLDVSRTTGNGWALRLRFEAGLNGPCMRCLDPADPRFEVDAREVFQPGGGEELESPYDDDIGELDLRAWAHDALALALPAQLTCRPDCAGLCPQCGANLNTEPDHQHEPQRDPRFDKLSEIRFE